MAEQQKFEFKAEMKQLLHLIINSLYTNPEVFLRELISNSSDALNKANHLKLTGEKIHSADLPLQIKISLDEDAQTFSIEDTGIGMTRDDLLERLGTVASSGTLEYIKKAQESEGKLDGNLIGQFGVGFYSAFMVTDEVTVETRHASPRAKSWKWVSDGKGTFAVEETDRTERGTKITFKLNDDYKEFATKFKVEQTIRKYSNFVDYPIYVNDEQVNKQSAIWHKPKNEITDEELKEFYQFVANAFDEPLDHLHLAMEGRLNFKALLFVPTKSKPNFFANQEFKSVQLYSGKVFVKENCEELIPEYLRFVEGVVDSEDLPLNVSREVTQFSPVMNKIKEILTKKIFGLLEYWAESEPEKYKTFYKEFGSLFKSGMTTDFGNRERIVKLMRFHTTKTENDEQISLDTYVDRMKEEQKEIYYISGEKLSDLRKNPKLEYFRKRDVEVLLLNDPIDSFLMPGMEPFREKPFKSIEKSDIDLGGSDDEESADAVKGDELSALKNVIRDALGDRVEDVVESKRLVESAATLTVGKDGMDSHMERMMRMMDQETQASKKVLEINPAHPLIRNMNRLNQDGKQEIVKLVAMQLFEGALLLEGDLSSPGDFISRMTEVLEMATNDKPA